MRVAKVLLRWYKSFNINYMGYADRRAGVAARPWRVKMGLTTKCSPLASPVSPSGGVREVHRYREPR